MECIAQAKCFGGTQAQYKHRSESNNCDMTFSVYLPEASQQRPVPALYWLSGLTCTDQNFVTKAGAQRYAAEHQLALVMPDTSPRGEHVADAEDSSWDLGAGAGFYVNAIQEPWREHYQMYSYIVDELPSLLSKHLPLDAQRTSISGHSMGGHGALTIALNNPEKYHSVSAFAPIAAPSQCAWGIKALQHYLGDERSQWQKYDTCELIKKQPIDKFNLFVDQGTADDFLQDQLKPSLLEQACEASGQKLTLRYQEGYDHSYYFIASFIGEHIAFHAAALKE